jgi:hypothetical protein
VLFSLPLALLHVEPSTSVLPVHGADTIRIMNRSSERITAMRAGSDRRWWQCELASFP